MMEWIDRWIRAHLKNGDLHANYRKHQVADLPAAVLAHSP